MMDDRRSHPLPRRGLPPTSARSASTTSAVRRVVRRVTPRSAQGVLLRVIQEVLDPRWSPARAAHSIVAHVDGEVGPLRGARALLLAPAVDRATVSRARALVTLNLAIAQIEAAADDRDRSVSQNDDDDLEDEGGAES